MEEKAGPGIEWTGFFKCFVGRRPMVTTLLSSGCLESDRNLAFMHSSWARLCGA